MIIKEISVKNFRSIESCNVRLESMNVFAGCNDSGKSNLLKALNLFFNNTTDHDSDFNFEDDFCHFANVPAKKAPEIKIELLLSPPASYKGSKDFVWRKKWRRGHSIAYESEMFLPSVPKSESEVPNTFQNWANKLRYRYVPAMKGDNYFPHLLRDLYNILSISVDNELKLASKDFLSTISTHTRLMTSTINDQLRLNSEIKLPSDLSGLFETLDFGTSHNGNVISLKKRGDGVKIRHIPSILKFLHDEENRIMNKGAIKVNTIWGYEEPENNLELAATFAKSEEILCISSNIQVVTTTHSPAFYNLRKDSDSVMLYYTHQESSGTFYNEVNSGDKLLVTDQKMGLLPIIAPYMAAKEREIQDVKNAIEEITKKQSHTRNTIFVEGTTDKRLFEYCLQNLPNELEGDICVRADSSSDANWVRNSLIAWAMSPDVEVSTVKACGVFDRDCAGIKAKDGFESNMKFIGRKAHSSKVKAYLLTVPKHLFDIVRHEDFDFDFSIEELFPSSTWMYALDQGWLEKRSLADSYRMDKLPDDKSLINVVDDAFPDFNTSIYLKYKFKAICKGKFADYLISEASSKPEIFEYLNRDILKIVEYINK